MELNIKRKSKSKSKSKELKETILKQKEIILNQIETIKELNHDKVSAQIALRDVQMRHNIKIPDSESYRIRKTVEKYEKFEDDNLELRKRPTLKNYNQVVDQFKKEKKKNIQDKIENKALKEEVKELKKRPTVNKYKLLLEENNLIKKKNLLLMQEINLIKQENNNIQKELINIRQDIIQLNEQRNSIQQEKNILSNNYENLKKEFYEYDKLIKVFKRFTNTSINDILFDAIKKYIPQEELNECSICLSNPNDTMTECGHFHCSDCISKIVGLTNRCSVCRSKINEVFHL